VRVLAWCAVVVALAGCGGISTNVIERSAATTTTTTATTSPTPPAVNPHPCANETLAPPVPARASYRPERRNPAPGAMLDDTTMSTIQNRKPTPRLKVGVDETTQGLAYRDAVTKKIEGMEVELALEIARRILGDRNRDDILELVPVRTDQKLAVVQDGQVDLTIDAISMSCARWADVDFSTEYLTTDQRLLVPKDSTIHTKEGLDGRTVCVTSGSSSVGILELNAPGARLRKVDARTDCLVALQEGSVDAYFGHDTFLHGMLLQDPTLLISDVRIARAETTTSHYGIAIAHEHKDLVLFVNQALDDMRADGTLGRLQAGLEQGLGLEPAAPPVAVYLPEGS
jgi:polar amino acid transport system substrate-binding protein